MSISTSLSITNGKCCIRHSDRKINFTLHDVINRDTSRRDLMQSNFSSEFSHGYQLNNLHYVYYFDVKMNHVLISHNSSRYSSSTDKSNLSKIHIVHRRDSEINFRTLHLTAILCLRLSLPILQMSVIV